MSRAKAPRTNTQENSENKQTTVLKLACYKKVVIKKKHKNQN